MVEDILYIRESIEQETLSRIIERDNNQELLQQLTDNIKLQNKFVEETEFTMEKFYKVDNEFHGYLLKAIDKRDVMSLIQEQNIHVRRCRNFEVRNVNRL